MQKCQLPSGLIKKRIPFNWSGVSSVFDSSQALFSSVDIDVGTKALLNSLRKDTSVEYTKILDLGCGYGVLGIFLKKMYLAADVVLSDRDALAYAFTMHNAELNAVEVKSVVGVDYEGVADNDFSLIVTNYPAKMEEQGLYGFIAGASRHLRSGGMLAMVIVNELIPAFTKVAESFNGGLEVCYEEHKKGHTLLHIKFNKRLDDELHYERGSLHLKSGEKLVTARGLPEFDTLSYATEEAVKLLTVISKPRSICFIEPNQGALPVTAAKQFSDIEGITLISRDLLALKFTELNLRNYYKGDLQVQALPYLTHPQKEDLVIWRIAGKNNSVVHEVNLPFLQGKKCLIYGEAGLLNSLSLKYGLKFKSKSEYLGNWACIL